MALKLKRKLSRFIVTIRRIRLKKKKKKTKGLNLTHIQI